MTLAAQRAAAARLASAVATGKPVAPIRDLIAITDLEGAYAVQSINVQRVLASGSVLVGRKIGLTSSAVQAQLGVDQPDYGALFGDMNFEESRSIPMSRFLQPKIEAEVAFVIGQDLDTPPTSIEEAAASVAFASPALEIVDSRIAGWDIRIVDTVADNASSAGFVIGNSRVAVDALDLVACRMTMRRNGEIVSEGQGKACLGNPLNALVWLSTKMCELGTPLKRGELVLSGALGPMTSVAPGDYFEATIEGLGVVTARFATT